MARTICTVCKCSHKHKMSRERLFFFGRFAYTTLVFAVLVPHISDARNINNLCTSSCGNIADISYPFRLKTDPINCGDHRYELACENNLTILYLSSVKYYVQAIYYDSQAIRVRDANVNKDNCSSIPLQSLTRNQFFDGRFSIPYYYHFGLERDEGDISIIFIKCANPVLNSPLYVDTSTCINSEAAGYSYVKVGNTSITVSELVDSCRIELVTMTSWYQLIKDLHNISYLKVHNSMVYGFELSWYFSPNSCNNNRPYCFLLTLLNGLSYALYYLDYALFRVLSAFNIKYYIYISDPYWINYPVYVLYCLFIFIVQYHILLFLFGAPCIVALFIYKWRRRHLSMFNSIEEFLQSQANFMPIRYTYSDIRRITKGFKDKLGEGGFGSVYKGKLRSGRLVAVKILDKTKADDKDFISEVGTIGKIHHVNVVQLIGFCVKGSKRALVYEFMANGSLDKFIFSQDHNMVLSNDKMYEISLGVAQGIEYLHRGCDMQILHFDIKPHNILLDEKFHPKISDFGLAKLYPTNNSIVSLTAARGTLGYMASELFYKNIGGVSYKADVYSFGMLLMEMAGRRKNLNAFEEHLSQIYFPSWAYDQIRKGKDIGLGDATYDEKNITKKMIIVALWCIQLKPDDRPPMHRVIEMLEREVEFIEMPPKPSLSLQDQTTQEET